MNQSKLDKSTLHYTTLLCSCAWNSAVQVLATFPGILHYLDEICRIGLKNMKLHQGLRDQLRQLRSLSGTGVAGSVEGFMTCVHQAAQTNRLKGMSAKMTGWETTSVAELPSSVNLCWFQVCLAVQGSFDGGCGLL